MPLINLIQEQRLSNRREEARSRLFFMSFVGSAVASAAAFGFFLYKTDAAQGELSQLQAKNQKMAPMLRQIEQNNKLISTLQPRLATLENAQKMTARWNTILDHLVVNIPDQTWLTAIRCQSQDATKPIEISFVGLSANQELVGDLMLRLQGCAEFDGLNLKYTQEKVVAQGNGIEFELSGSLAGSAEQKPVDEAKQEGQQ
jgi:Tfp pilus assembly protein PilN